MFQNALLKQVRVPPHRVQAKEVVIVGQLKACYVAASLYASCRVEAAVPEIDKFEAEQLRARWASPPYFWQLLCNSRRWMDSTCQPCRCRVYEPEASSGSNLTRTASGV